MADYALSVMFLSNEHPWSMVYDKPKVYMPKTDEEAIDWARGMREGLTGYQVTLLRDGHPVDIDGFVACLAEARNSALEEAAKSLDAFGCNTIGSGAATLATELAKRIRALKEAT